MHGNASAAGNTRREFLIAAGAALVPGATLAQEYPSKAIRIVSPFSPGATSDLVVDGVSFSSLRRLRKMKVAAPSSATPRPPTTT